MTKKSSALSQTVPNDRWKKMRDKERITYPDGAPDHTSWRTPGTYTGAELTYRGQERRKIISLAGRPL